MATVPHDSLQLFSPPIAGWFEERFGEPTDVQAKAWPRIAAGEHVLLTAPTGSGKTLAAFLWALDRLLTGEWEPGATRVLYISPLKALGNDIRRNLTEPLADLTARFTEDGDAKPVVRVESRTGDTPQSARRRMQRSPPEILITTPETLNILLTSKSGRRLLTGLRCVILDEVHAVASGKRGVHLITAVERLAMLSGEIQRIALSATVRPLDRMARWVGGFTTEGDPSDPDYRPRPVAIVASDAPKAYDLEVVLPTLEADAEQREPDSFWTSFGSQLRRSITNNRSTLIFGNARRSVEKITRFINEAAPDRVAYSHHGSLSREIRAVVEQRLKDGELKAIVATSSLELGIDIGAIDEVVMVQTPPSVASTLQRLGRAGHGVGETSRGRLMPLLGRDLLEAAVVARCVVDGEIEELTPVMGPLDVLAQVLVSIVIADDWRSDELFAAIRRSDPYHHLPRRQFDLVLQMLAGRYSSSRIRSLRPLVSIDAVDGTIRARPGVERLIYLSGGTIPDRGYYQLRIEGSGALLGELDEEFVWERSVGDTFTLGVQTWRVERITHNDVLVSPVSARSAMAPFWRAEELDRSSFVSQRMAELLEQLDDRLDDDDLASELAISHHIQPTAGRALIAHLRQQHAATGCLPHRHRIIVEHTSPPAGRGNHRQMVLHTMWGGRVNRPFAAALAAAWETRYGLRPEVVHSADCVVVVYPSTIDIDDPFVLVRVSELEDLLRRAVERTGFFGARFREAAGRALLLPKAGPGKRVPLWVNRQRAKELLEAVQNHDDFPLVLEAWRSCLQDEYELDVLRHRLDEVADGRVALCHVRTETPSPFTAQAAWKQTNELMYEDDVPTAPAGARSDLVSEMALSSHLRPRVAPELAKNLNDRLQRLALGWSPRDSSELLEWLKERLIIPEAEWIDLLAAIKRDHDLAAAEVVAGITHRAVMLDTTGRTVGRLVCAVELLPRLEDAFEVELPDQRLLSVSDDSCPRDAIEARQSLDPTGGPAEDADALVDFLAEWLRFYTPIEPSRIAATLGIADDRLDSALAELVESQAIVVDELLEDAVGPEVCDRINLERLLRMARAEARPSLEPLPAEALPLLLAEHQNLGTRDAAPEDLLNSLEQLFGMPLSAELWETEILPARLDPYIPGWLDALLTESDLRWVGAGPKRLLFSLDGELDLFRAQTEGPVQAEETEDVFPHRGGRFSLENLIRFSGLDSTELTNKLWKMVWQGSVSADSFAPIRQGSAGAFSVVPPPDVPPNPRRGRRPRFDRWRRDRPFAGSWFSLPRPEEETDILARDDDDRERARIILDRYGIVFRGLMQRELPHLKWGSLFRALRMLELGGEVVAGRFVDGLDGLQFATHQTIRRLRDGLGADRVWWVNAMDPASPCSIGLDLPAWPLPRRVPGNHLVFHGQNLIVVSQRRGAELTIRVAPDHPDLETYLSFLVVLLTRIEQPVKRVDLETVNDEPAGSSGYRPVLEKLFHVTRQPTALRLTRKY
jgi:ATP-dependent helicase Lhr and Lhr-like helicase